MPLMNPVSSISETPRERDMRLLVEWKTAVGFKKEQKLTELLDSLGGPIGTAVNAFRGAPMPQVTVELEAKRLAVEALNDFNPALTQMSLATFIITRVKQRLARYVGTYQNVARLPEHQINQIGAMREAVTDLTSRFKREPTAVEIADHMGIPVAHVTRLRKNLRSDLMAESGGLESMEAFETDPDFERAMLVYYSLNDQEKHVFDYSMGAHGQPRLAAGEMAKRLNISAGRVSQIKDSIATKIKAYLNQ